MKILSRRAERRAIFDIDPPVPEACWAPVDLFDGAGRVVHLGRCWLAAGHAGDCKADEDGTPHTPPARLCTICRQPLGDADCQLEGPTLEPQHADLSVCVGTLERWVAALETRIAEVERSAAALRAQIGGRDG